MFTVQAIYDAAFDEQQFPDLLRQMTLHFDAQAGFIGWSNEASQAGFQAEYGNDPAYLKAYVETYAELDVLRPALMAAPEGDPQQAHGLLQTPAIQASRFYREYIAPQAIVDNLAVNLIKRDGVIATIAILRTGDVEPFDDSHLTAMRDLVPHLRRAVFLSSYRVRQADMGSIYRDAAGGARDGLVLLGDDGRVLDLGPEIEAITGFASAETASRSPFGRVLAQTMHADAPALHEFTFGKRTVRLLLSSQPLARNPYGDLCEGSGAAYAVSVIAVDRRWELAYGAMAAAHGLTPGEARILEDVLSHGDMAGSPDRLGIASATARSHLHRIYAKTGTRGFPDLCLLAHRFIAPGR